MCVCVVVVVVVVCACVCVCVCVCDEMVKTMFVCGEQIYLSPVVNI